MGEGCSTNGEMRRTPKVLGGNLEEMRPLGRHRSRWQHNNRTDLKEMGTDGVDWTHLAHDRGQWRAVVNTVMNIWVP